MKFSNNTIIVENYPEEQEHLLYSTRTQALVKINQELKHLIESYNQLPGELRERHLADIKSLYRMGLIVRDEEDDRAKLKSFLDQLKLGVIKKSLPVTVLTTYACNFKCTYCFQESSRNFERMSSETADHLMSWIKAKIEKLGYEELYLIFYGGEPLVNKPTLEYIASHMKQWCEAKEVRFKFLLQTNGYLMTPSLIEKYKGLGLQKVRISVDGVGEDHDKNRPLRGGGGTFGRITQNIAACADQIEIGISVTYDKGDVTPIARLLDYFDDMGVLHKLGRFICSPIHPTLGPKDEPEKIVAQQCMCNYEDKLLVEANKKIGELMEKKGLATKSGMSISICPVTRDNAGVTIDQEGRIFKCNSMLGHPELSTGNVRDNDYNDRHREFINLDIWRQCPQDCTYMPMCSGGCRLMSFLDNKNFRVASCKKPYLNKMTPEFIKRDYDERMAQKAPRKGGPI